MFEKRQIAAIEGKCRRFWNSSECLKAQCSANNWSIWTQKVAKEAYRCVTTFYRSSFKNILLYKNIRLSKIRSVRTYVMPGRFILVESVPRTFFYWNCRYCWIDLIESCLEMPETLWKVLQCYLVSQNRVLENECYVMLMLSYQRMLLSG